MELLLVRRVFVLVDHVQSTDKADCRKSTIKRDLLDLGFGLPVQLDFVGTEAVVVNLELHDKSFRRGILIRSHVISAKAIF